MSGNSKAPRGVETHKNSDGSNNPKYVDVLEEDKPVAGQKFVCISFISPEKILEDKNRYFFKQFLKQWDMNKSLEKFTHFLSYISYKHDLSMETLTNDMQEFVKEEKDNLFTTTLEDEYKTWNDNNEDKLSAEFDESNQFQTSTRGVKIRGSYPTQGEAELRAKILREMDPNHDVFVGPVGMWMPYHPEAYKTGRVEYLEDELNQLMHEKNKNEAKAKTEFETRVKEAKKKAMEDNKRKAMETGNLLTQTIDNEGNLVSVKDVSTFDNKLGEDVSVADIRKELFEDENVVIDKNTDHGLSNLSLNKENDNAEKESSVDESARDE
jgi:ribosomal protein S25